MHLLVVIMLSVLSALPAAAAVEYVCASCGKPIYLGTVWVFKGPKLTNYVCDICYKLPTICSVCRLPAGDGHIKLSDGRIICRKDRDKVMLREDEAVRSFWETRRDVERLTGGGMGLRSPNLTVRLFDSPFWASKSVNPDADEMHVLGIAASPKTADGFYHNVNLLSGELRPGFNMTSAHEFTHLWINENRPVAHKIDGNTIEAICELVSYKLAEARQLPEEMERIKANPYTKGKILDLIAYEKEFGLQSVLDWVKTGTSSTLSAKESSKPGQTAETPFFVPAPGSAARTTTMELKGLTGTGKRRLALINERSFESGEEGTLRLGEKTVTVKCIEIREYSVLVRVDGAEPVTLTLDGR